MRADIADKLNQFFEELAAPLRVDLATIAQAVAAEFHLAPEEAPLLLHSRGAHRLTVPKSVVVVLALQWLPVTRAVLARLLGVEDSAIYRMQAGARLRASGDAEFSAKLQRLREQLPSKLTGPRRNPRKTKPRKETIP